jgi:alkane 1-monooxygenase
MDTVAPTQHVKPGVRDTKNFVPVWWYYLLTPAFLTYGYVMRQYFDLFWAFIFVSYGIIPMLDQVLPMDWKNPTLKQITELESDPRYRIVVYLTVTLDIIMFFSEMGTISSFTIFNVIPRLFVLANVYTTGMLVSHELMHKESSFDRAFATIILIKNCYLHFTVEHTLGHHKNVSTPFDPATAPKGMTFYEFIPRSVKGGFLSAYRINPRFVILSVISSIVFQLVIYKMLGWKVLLVHLTAALGSIILL